jgi:hypothetical protein
MGRRLPSQQKIPKDIPVCGLDNDQNKPISHPQPSSLSPQESAQGLRMRPRISNCTQRWSPSVFLMENIAWWITYIIIEDNHYLEMYQLDNINLYFKSYIEVFGSSISPRTNETTHAWGQIKSS